MTPTIKQDPSYGLRPRVGTPARPTAMVTRQAAGTNTHSTLNIVSSPVLLELQDTFFNHDSAVMMPDLPAGPAGQTQAKRVENAERARRLQNKHPVVYDQYQNGPHDPDPVDTGGRVSGLSVLAATYKFLQLNTEYRLLLAGHADTSGDVSYNYTLSDLRARNVLHLLRGERSQWVSVCESKSKVEDYQRILRHYARVAGLRTDPGEVNNQDNEATRQALLNFQIAYNRSFSPRITEDGLIGRETWGAIFDVYMAELASMLNTDTAGLASYRSSLRFVNNAEPYIACSEKHPIDQPNRDNFRSAENRRVEVLFFRPPYMPFLGCHGSTKPYCMRACDIGECGVYAPGFFEFVFLDAQALLGRLPGQEQPKFEIKPSNEDLNRVPDAPDEAYDSSNATSDVPEASAQDPTTAWDFLEFFDERAPNEGSPEQRPASSGGRR